MLEERMRGVVPFEPVLSGIDMDPVATWRSGRVLQRRSIQVVLALMKKDVRLTMVAARMLGIPTVIRHYEEKRLPPGFRGRFLYGAAAMHVTNAEAVRRAILHSAPWLSPSKTEVIYNGIDTALYSSAEPIEIDIPHDAIRFGFVANFVRRKGIDELARAWRKVSEAVPRAHLVIAGKGVEEARFRQMLDIATRVHWIGYRRDVPRVLRALDVLVLPSHIEGAPNVVQEAMAAGIAIIATAVSGTPELLRDGLEARLIPAHDSDSLASAMIELALGRGLRQRLAEAGRVRVVEKFTLGEMINRYEDLLGRVVRGNASA